MNAFDGLGTDAKYFEIESLKILIFPYSELAIFKLFDTPPLIIVRIFLTSSQTGIKSKE